MAEARGGMQRQQAGSKRPAERTGAAKQARKKREPTVKGTARPGTAKKSRPGKTRAFRKARSRKP
jgi:hypothetical protein